MLFGSSKGMHVDIEREIVTADKFYHFTTLKECSVDLYIAAPGTPTVKRVLVRLDGLDCKAELFDGTVFQITGFKLPVGGEIIVEHSVSNADHPFVVRLAVTTLPKSIRTL